MKRIRVVAALVVLVILLLMAIVFWPPAARSTSPLQVQFLRYGTDSQGRRTAEFTLTNRSEHTLLRESHCRVEFQDDPHSVPAYDVSQPRSLTPGETETVVIPAPANQGPWRAGFKVLKQDRRFEAVDWANRNSLIPQAIYHRNYNGRIEVSRSEWIAE
jgi:hypothetical protein